MATGDSQKNEDILVENLKKGLQTLNTTCAVLENEEIRTGGRLPPETIESVATVCKSIQAKAGTCEVLCGKIKNMQEAAMNRNAIILEDRDSGFTGSGIYAQETEEDGNVIAETDV